MFLCRRSLVRPQAALRAAFFRCQSYATVTPLPKSKKKFKREKPAAAAATFLAETAETAPEVSEVLFEPVSYEVETEVSANLDSQDPIETTIQPPTPKKRVKREKPPAGKITPSPKPKKSSKREKPAAKLTTTPPAKPKKQLKREGPKGEKKKKETSTHSHYPIAYTRRIEGLVEFLDKPVLTDIQPIIEQRPIAKLSHGLDRVLFNPGIHWLQDPRSRVYNYTPWLENIPKVYDFAFERLTGFVKSSHDEEIWDLLKREDKTFAGSTSSLTGILGQIYFLISGDKPVNIQSLSHIFYGKPKYFTPGQRMPSSVLFNHRDGKYAIDSNSKTGHPDKNILTWLGTLMEKYLTMPPEQFKSFMRSFPEAEEASDSRNDAFRYAKSDRFLLRSQLDCQDDRLPGTGIFDIKTRACLPVRLDILNFEEHSGYLIRSQHGLVGSFEKEYYDLIRSAFLKYSFQARIGNMDGVFVAYHNTARMFGFQYIPLQEMEDRLYGRGNGVGEQVFEKCISLLEIISQEVTQCFPGKSVRCTFETKEGNNKLDIWVEPADWDDKSKRPIIQLEVRATNYIGLSEVKGSRAIEICGNTSDAKWSIHWIICRSSEKENNIRAALRDAQGRQFRAYFFPTGVDAREMPEFWAGLNFGGEKAEIAYKGENFRQASGSIQQLREVSRAGKEELDRIAAQEAGKPKIVFGQSEPWNGPTTARSGVPVHSGYDFSDEALLSEMEQE